MRSFTCNVLLFVLVSLTCASLAGPQPCLLFSKEEVPAIRQRLNKAHNTAIWQDILKKANDFCTPGSGKYADPATVARPVEGVRIQVMAHRFGRELTKHVETLGFAYHMTGDPRLRGTRGQNSRCYGAEPACFRQKDFRQFCRCPGRPDAWLCPGTGLAGRDHDG